MNYPIVIHRDKKSDYGVTVPDLPGCFTAGRTIDEALAMAQEAIELHLEGLIDEGQPIPQPGTIEQHLGKAEYQGGTWALVNINPSSLRLRAVRVDITLPERLLDAVDRYAKASGKTRSGLLAEAVTTYMGREGRPRRRRNKAG